MWLWLDLVYLYSACGCDDFRLGLVYLYSACGCDDFRLGLVYLYSACGCDDFRLGPGVFVQCLWLWWFQTGTWECACTMSSDVSRSPRPCVSTNGLISEPRTQYVNHSFLVFVCYPPVWNLRAVIWLPFCLPLFFYLSPAVLSVSSFFYLFFVNDPFCRYPPPPHPPPLPQNDDIFSMKRQDFLYGSCWAARRW